MAPGRGADRLPEPGPRLVTVVRPRSPSASKRGPCVRHAASDQIADRDTSARLEKTTMLKKIAIVAGLAVALSVTAEAQTPRKGGTIRMTAPYGSSFTSLDIHTTQRAQDEIFAKGLHRSLYIWDSAEGKPAPELAKEAVVSGGGLVYTFKLRDDAYFHHGRKMTADDIIWSYNRIMDGAKAYPGARFVRLIEGAADVEKGQAKAISGLKKINDLTLTMKLTEKVDPVFYFFPALTSVYPADEGAKEGF